MVAVIADGATNQFDVLRWAWEQGQHLDPTAHHLLVYLCAHAFYTEDNPERGEIGQVYRQASSTEEMRRCTGIRSRITIRGGLNRLQDQAYIQRGERQDPHRYGQQSHLIFVLWEQDRLREEIRAGRPLPDALKARPQALPQRYRPLAEVVVLYPAE